MASLQVYWKYRILIPGPNHQVTAKFQDSNAKAWTNINFWIQTRFRVENSKHSLISTMPQDLVQIPTKAARNEILWLPLAPWGALGAKISVQRRISLEKARKVIVSGYRSQMPLCLRAFLPLSLSSPQTSENEGNSASAVLCLKNTSSRLLPDFLSDVFWGCLLSQQSSFKSQDTPSTAITKIS